MDDTVELLNRGRRRKERKSRSVYKKKEYKEHRTDPLAINVSISCRHKNSKTFKCDKLTKNDIIVNRRRFYKNTSKINQDIYLTRLVAPYEPEKRGRAQPRQRTRCRKLSCTYFVYKKKTKLVICKKTFMKIYSFGQKRLQNLLMTIHSGKVPTEHRGGDRKSRKSEAKRECLREFLKKMPASESHYGRNKSKRIYLSSDLNAKQLFQMYNASVGQELKISRTMFYSVFNEFNIGFKQPASDMCGTCILWKNKIKNEQDPHKKQMFMLEKRVHSMRASAFYTHMKNEPPDSLSYCFDLEKVQPLPRTPIQDAYYSRQISIYNFCVVETSARNPKFFTWVETQSGRGAVEICSALYSFLTELDIPQNITTLRLFCGGCGGQNKNSHMLHVLIIWLMRMSPSHVTEIHLFFPVRGHSFLPADRVFGRLEKDIKMNPVLINKENYHDIYKKHGDLAILGEGWHLYDIKGLEKFYKKFCGIQSMKRFKLKKIKSSQGRPVECKVKSFENYRFETGEEREDSLTKKKKQHPISLPRLGRSYTQQISANKRKDVISLLVKQFGNEWKELPELMWYSRVLCDELISNDGDEDIVMDNDHQHENNEGCLCLVPDIGDIRV